MRIVPFLILAPFLLVFSGCGGTEERTVIVNPEPGHTVVVPPSGQPRDCPDGRTSC